MPNHTFVAGAAVAALLSALSMQSLPANAQQRAEQRADQQEAEILREIRIVAPRVTREEMHPIGERITVDKQAQVNLADLDLTRDADVRELEQRVEAAATRICEELAQELPFGEPSTPVCINRAVEDVQAQVDEAVRQAHAR